MVAPNPETRRQHYYKNKEPYLIRAREQRKEINRWLNELKEASPCMDCDTSFPYYVMHFDHRPGEVKLWNVSRLRTIGSKKRIKEEIAKCDLVCANCHAKRTHLRNMPSEPGSGESPKLAAQGAAP